VSGGAPLWQNTDLLMMTVRLNNRWSGPSRWFIKPPFINVADRLANVLRFNRPDACMLDSAVLPTRRLLLLLRWYFINSLPRASSIARCQRARDLGHTTRLCRTGSRAGAHARACVTRRCRHKAVISLMSADYRSILEEARLLT